MEKFSDLSISSSKIPPNLCDLPMEIIEMIMEKLDFTRRIIVRKTCKTLREMIDRLEPCYCNEIKMTIGLEECELRIEGYSIKYKKSKGGNVEKMLTDLPIFIPNLHFDTLIVRFSDEKFTWYHFIDVYVKCVPQPMEIRLLIFKTYQFFRPVLYSSVIKTREIRFIEIQLMEKYEDDIVKVKVMRTEFIEDDRRQIYTASRKYLREGQEDILVDQLSQLPPILPKPAKTLKTTKKAWNPYFSKYNSLKL